MVCSSPAATKDWYARVLRLEINDHGGFAWLIDPDGRKVELWEPVSEG